MADRLENPFGGQAFGDAPFGPSFATDAPADEGFKGPTFRRRVLYPSKLGSALVLLASIVTAVPFNQLDWQNPRGPQRGTIDLYDVTDSFKLPLTTVRAPYLQTDWPNPQRPRRGDGFTQSSLSLQFAAAVRPTIAKDWPNPRGYRPINLGWTDSFKLPLQTIEPSNQYDWPVPRGYAPLNRGWTDSFKLPLQTIEPFNQYDWLVPKSAKSNPWYTQEGLGLDFAAAVRPINQYDWPVPKGWGQRQYWTDSFKLSLQTVTPSNQYDWPLARGPGRIDLTWTQSGNALTGVTAAPFSQSYWPVPWGAKSVVSYWMLAGNAILPVAAVQEDLGAVGSSFSGPTFGTVVQYPAGQLGTPITGFPATPTAFKLFDWPVPKGPRHSHVGYTQPALTFATIIGTTPFAQDEWPNPRGYVPSIQLRTWIDVGKLPPKLVIPRNQFDWPVPRGPRRAPDDWVRGEPLPQLVFVNTPPSGNQRDWPNPRAALRGSLDWVAGTPYALSNTVVVVTKPVTTSDWPVPRARQPRIVDYQQRNQGLLGSVTPLNPIAGQKTYVTSQKISTTGPNLVLTLLSGKDILPENQFDWPNPRGRVPAISLKTWIGRFSLGLTGVKPPSTQYDWPNPRGAQHQRQPFGFIGGLTALVIPQPAFLGPDPGCAIVGGYFSKGQWHTVIGTPCKPVKRRSYKEPGFSRQQYEDLLEAIRTGEYQPSQRKVKRWYEGGAFSRAQFDDIKATIRLEQETKAQQEKLAREALAFAEARAHEDRLAAIEAQAQALQAQNELQSLANQTEAAARLEALQRNIELSKAMAEFAKQAKLEEDDDEEAIRLLFDG